MKKLIIAVVLLISIASFSQNDEAYVDGLVSEFTEKLEQRNIKEYFYTKRHCLGNIQMFQMPQGRMCSSKGTYFETYVVWKEDNGKTMLKKFDNCGIFTSVEIISDDIILFVQENDKLLKRAVKKYEVANPENAPTLSTKIHPCSREFKFTSGTVSYGQAYKEFYLTNESKYPNINFDYNKSLKVVELDAMMSEIIGTFDKQGKFIRLQF